MLKHDGNPSPYPLRRPPSSAILARALPSANPQPTFMLDPDALAYRRRRTLELGERGGGRAKSTIARPSFERGTSPETRARRLFCPSCAAFEPCMLSFDSLTISALHLHTACIASDPTTLSGQAMVAMLHERGLCPDTVTRLGLHIAH